MLTLRDEQTLNLIEELIGRANLAMIRTLNVAAEKIFEESQVQVPKSGRHEVRPDRPDYPVRPLQELGHVDPATLEDPVAQVVYDGPYAAAQEVGQMVYTSRGGNPVEWEAQNYTTPGTKSRYLEDSAKMILAQIPEELAIQGRIAYGELSGPVMAKSSLKAAGYRQEEMPVPTGDIGHIMSQEETRGQQATTVVTPSAPPILQGG